MTHRKTLTAIVLGLGAAGLLFAASASAQDKIEPEEVAKATQGNPDRYSLVAVEDGILRVDRQNGTVSVCSKRNADWRCSPVPMAEDAYLAEINDLAAEVDRLTARLEELEETGKADTRPLPPGSALDRPDVEKPAPGAPSADNGSRLDEDAEEELEKVLSFTESAMRRFFGMVRDLKKDFEAEENR